MAYMTVPRDLTKVKHKVMLGLTKRQLLCFGCGALIGVPLFFLLREPLGVSAAIIVMIITMVPAMLFALYEKNGLPFETHLRNMLNVMFLRPKVRPYRTENLYDAIIRQQELRQEVKRIVQAPLEKETKNPAKKADAAAKAGHSGGDIPRTGGAKKRAVRTANNSV